MVRLNHQNLLMILSQLKEGQQLRLKNIAMQNLQNLLPILLFLSKDPQLHLTNVTAQKINLGLNMLNMKPV